MKITTSGHLSTEGMAEAWEAAQNAPLSELIAAAELEPDNRTQQAVAYYLLAILEAAHRYVSDRFAGGEARLEDTVCSDRWCARDDCERRISFGGFGAAIEKAVKELISTNGERGTP